MLLLVVGIILCGVTAVLVTRAIAMPRLRTEAGLATIGAYGFPVEIDLDAGDEGPLTQALDRLAERVGGAMLPRLNSAEEDEVRTLLVSAGVYGTSPGKFLGYRILSAIALAGTWLWIGPSASPSTLLFLLILPVITLCGWTIPLSLLRVRADRRIDQIDSELPELIDSLVVTLEAGVGFGGALRMAAREVGGPLGAELQLTLQEQNMGLSSAEALNNLQKRVNIPSMRSFITSVTQGENLGVSIGDIMRGLAIEMRARRRAKAEERAQKAPIKMLFPLVFFIFPAVLIVLLYPAISEFKAAFGG